MILRSACVLKTVFLLVLNFLAFSSVGYDRGILLTRTILVFPFFSPLTSFLTTLVAFFGRLSSGFLALVFCHLAMFQRPRLWNIRPRDKRMTPDDLSSPLIGLPAFFTFLVVCFAAAGGAILQIY